MKKTFRILVVAVFSIFLLSGSALALSIDFGYHGFGAGVVTSDGIYGTGSGILIDEFTIEDNPYGPEVEMAVNLTMAFAYTPTENYIRIYGENGDWLTGSFTVFQVNQLSPVISIYGEGPDSKAPWLLREYGIPTDIGFDFFGFTIATSGEGGARSVDIINTPVPEPASMLLLGLGLLGIGIISRKK